MPTAAVQATVIFLIGLQAQKFEKEQFRHVPLCLASSRYSLEPEPGTPLHWLHISTLWIDQSNIFSHVTKGAFEPRCHLAPVESVHPSSTKN